MADLVQELRARREARRAQGAPPALAPPALAPANDLAAQIRAARLGRSSPLVVAAPPVFAPARHAPSAARAARPRSEQWVVYVAQEDETKPDIAPVLVDAPTRWDAERRVSGALRVPADRCFVMPPLPALVPGALSLDRHPMHRPALKEEGRLDFDAFMLAMQNQRARGDRELAELEQMTADLLGVSLGELEARQNAERAEQQKQAVARKAEARARRQGQPPSRAVESETDGPTSAAARRVLTARERELVGLVAVDEESNRVWYPGDDILPDWDLLKHVVETLGGVWRKGGRKRKGGFEFPPEIDAVEAIALARETGEIFDPKLVGYYPTPDGLADALVAPLAIRPGERVLEPSGGDGALARAVRRACPEARIVCVDLLKPHVAQLREQGFEARAGDFLKLGLAELGQPFDVVVMNPPYGGQGRPEIRHVLHALDLLRVGGRLGALLPNSLRYRQDGLTTALRAELERLGAVIQDNPHGSFESSGTMINTVSVWCTLTTRAAVRE